jgi:hypothetical protein
MRLFISGATATIRRHLDRDRLGLLLVPDAGNSPQVALSLGLPWAADNAAFSGFRPNAFCGLLARISGHPDCRFVACPDVVGNAGETLRLFQTWAPILRSLGLPVALVGQDGVERLDIPWQQMDALFIGGSTDWKLSPGAASIIREAKRRSLWVHMGRVNTRLRFRYAHRLECDSVDGSGFSRWPEQRIPIAIRWMAEADGRPTRTAFRSSTDLFRGGDPFAARGWSVEHAERTPSGYAVTVRSAEAKPRCPCCAESSDVPPYRHGHRSQMIWDAPRNGAPVKLIFRRTRFRCQDCGAVFGLRPVGLSTRSPITVELAEWLVENAAVATRVEMARQIGVSDRTVRKWLRGLNGRRDGGPLAIPVAPDLSLEPPTIADLTDARTDPPPRSSCITGHF